MAIPRGAARTIRFNTSEATVWAMPTDIDRIQIYNPDATNKLEFNFENDETGNFRTLEPKTGSPVMGVKGDSDLELNAPGSDVDVEILAWAK